MMMRKILSAALLLLAGIGFLPAAASAQSNSFSVDMEAEPHVTVFKEYNLITLDYIFHVVNTTNAPISLIASRTKNELPSPDIATTVVCWGDLCYDAKQSVYNANIVKPGKSPYCKVTVTLPIGETKCANVQMTFGVEFTSESAASDIVACAPTSTTGVDEANLVTGVKIAPNPAAANPTMTLPTELQTAGELSLNLFTIKGAKASEQRFPAGSQSVVVNTSDLPNGVYFYQIVAGQKEARGTIVVAK